MALVETNQVGRTPQAGDGRLSTTDVVLVVTRILADGRLVGDKAKAGIPEGVLDVGLYTVNRDFLIGVKRGGYVHGYNRVFARNTHDHNAATADRKSVV